MSKVIRYLPEIEDDEQVYVAQLMSQMTDEQAEQFAQVYRQRRKDPPLILFTALLGFVGFAGVHRFLLGQVGMGLLYFLTAGLCLIGTIVDLFNYKALTYRHNQRKADEVSILIRGALPHSDPPRRLE